MHDGGYRMSGYGRQSGKQHLEAYLNVKAVWIIKTGWAFSWFETRGIAALLTMRDLILRRRQRVARMRAR
jgi:hypothetical protein